MTKPVRPELVPPAEGQRHKRFRLSIVGADEDMPRLVRAYGRACQGEFGLVLRPPEQHGVLVLVTKKDGAYVWEAKVEGKADSPPKPNLGATAAAAVALVKDAQKSPPKVGPVTLRGRWTGYLYCEGGQPRVELKRRLATYGTLWVFSNGADGWAWTFERDSKWFGRSGETYGKGLPTLLDALHIALLGAMTLVKDACSFRDTHRRAAHDDDYATKHPIKKREPKADPTERLKERAPKKSRAGTAATAPKPKPAPAPRSVNARDAVPEVPEDLGELRGMADKAADAGKELAAVSDVAPDWELVESPAVIAAWFEENGWQGIGEGITDYADDPTYPLGEFLDNVRKDLRASETVHDDDPDPKLYAEAREKIAALHTALLSAPVLLERARKLIRYARAMARSPLCRGREQKAALQAVEEAGKAYEAAREKIRRGHTWDPDRALRRVGEQVALAAAKAARSCASGQGALPPAPKKPTASRPPASKPPPRQPPAEEPRKRSPAKKPPAQAEVDADKDQALIDAFSKAFAAVLGDEAA